MTKARVEWQPSAIEFDTLPSERSPISPAARLLRKLAGNAAMNIHNYRAKRVIDRPKKNLDYYTRPGAFIERNCSEEQRAVLKSLTSGDASVLGFPKEWLEQ